MGAFGGFDHAISPPTLRKYAPLYAAVGLLGFAVAYLDPEGPRTVIAFSIGLAMEIAALTIFLRRQDSRARSREYSGESLELPFSDLGPGSNANG